MAIGFNEVPANARAPFLYAEFASDRAGATGTRFRTLAIGQRLAAGRVPALAPRVMNSVADAEDAFGANSMLAHMVAAFRRQTPLSELWAVGLDDAAGSTQTEITVTVGAAATGAGTISLYIAGRLVRVGISGAMTTAQVAAAINTAIGAAAGLPVTAGVAGSRS